MRVTWTLPAALALAALAQQIADGDAQSGFLSAQVSGPVEDHNKFLDHPNWLGPFVAAPDRVVEATLSLADVGRDDIVYDLGSGDGRIVLAAARDFRARAVGIEWDEILCEKTTLAIRRLGLQRRARVVCGDIFEQDIRPATVVTIYLLPASLERLAPMLKRQLTNGARIVSIDSEIPGWKAIEQEKVVASGRTDHWNLYLYRIQ